MLWGSDRYSNPVQMGWLYLRFSSPIYSLLVWFNKHWTGLLQKLWSSTVTKKVEIFDENYVILIASIGNWQCYAHVIKTCWQWLPEFWFWLDLGGMLILDSGILLALSLSCSYNFEVCAVEPPCSDLKSSPTQRFEKSSDLKRAIMCWVDLWIFLFRQ